MKKIDPTTLYTAPELRSILKGIVKIERLRQFGLVGSPGSGYWGQNIIDSLNKYWDHLGRQRETGKVKKEDHLENKNTIFDKTNHEVQDRPIHAAPRKTRAVESQRARFRRELSTHSV